MMISGFVSAADLEPSATISLQETELGFIIGGEWGHGTLNYAGTPHMFHMYGGKLGGGGLVGADITGDVYRLHDLADFSGVYFKAEAGLTTVEGIGGTWVKNNKGVTIHMKSKSKGFAMSVGVGGLKITLDH